MSASGQDAAERGAINLARIAPFRLEGLEVIPATRQFVRGTRRETLEPRVMQVMVALWEAGGAVVSRDDLIARCWAGRIVGDNAIQRAISRLREIAGGIGEGCFQLETVNRVGYRLIPLETAVESVAPDTPAQPASGRAGKARKRISVAAGAVLASAAIAAGLAIWARSPAASPITIAVAGRGGGSAELARGLAADLARFSNVRGAIAFSEAANGGRSDYVLTVAERRSGNRAQADLELLRNGARDMLWSASFAGVANLRQRAAAAVSMVTGCALDENSDPVRSNPDELRLVFSGCDRLDYVADDIDDGAISIWRRVVARDPNNARALATLAYLEAVRSTDGDLTPPIVAALRAAARAHFQKARATNGQLGLTYAAEAILIPDAQYGEKLGILDRGIARDPDCAVLHETQSYAFQKVGFMNSAVASARKAADLDRGYASRRTGLALALAYNGLTDEARKELAAAERIWPDSPAVQAARDRFDYRYGDAATLMRKIDRGIEVRDSPPTYALGIQRTFLLARLQPVPANIEAAAKAALKTGSPGWVQNLVALGRVDRAYKLLNSREPLAEMRDSTDVLFRSFMRPFLLDRRFMPLASKLGLVQYWLSSGLWPAFCYDKDIRYDCKAEAARLHAKPV